MPCRLDPQNHIYYTHEGEPVRYSVTQFIGRFFPPFRATTVAEACARKRGISSDQVLAEWRSASDRGTRVHEHIHFFLNGFDVDDDSGEFASFSTFCDDHPEWTLLKSEFIVHSRDIAGSIDALFLDEQGKVHMVDWKVTNKDLKHHYGRYAKTPIHHLQDTSYNRYSLQLNLYRQLVKEFIIFKMWIVQLTPTGYTKIEVYDMSTEINALLGLR